MAICRGAAHAPGWAPKSAAAKPNPNIHGRMRSPATLLRRNSSGKADGPTGRRLLVRLGLVGLADQFGGRERRRGRLDLLVLAGFGLLLFLVAALLAIGHWTPPGSNRSRKARDCADL